MTRSIAVGGVAMLAGVLLTGVVAPAVEAIRPAATEVSNVSDFSISVTPSSISTDPGYLAEATVSTATIGGPPQPVGLSASGLPAGAAAYFYPSSITSGESSVMRISTSTATAPGVYSVLVTAVGTGATRTATATVTVNGPAGCARTDDTDVAIPDNSTVETTILISHCEGDAAAVSTVWVSIVHSNIGDLTVHLAAPDGSLYLLHDRTGGTADNIDQTYSIDLSSEPSNGAWRLRVRDVAAPETGYVDSWAVNLRDNTGGCTGTNSTDIAIPDLGRPVTSSITISGCSGNESATSTVEVHILHPRIGDLSVYLVAPDGIVHVLHDRAGGSADDIHQTYTVDLSDEPSDGTWDLTVHDSQRSQVGHVDGWTLTL